MRQARNPASVAHAHSFGNCPGGSSVGHRLLPLLCLAAWLVGQLSVAGGGFEQTTADFKDPAADYVDPKIRIAAFDIRRLTITRRTASTIRIVYDLCEPMPPRPSPTSAFKLFFDLDRDPGTGDSFAAGMGVDLYVEIVISSNRTRWEGKVSCRSAVTEQKSFRVRKVKVKGSQAMIEVSSAAFKDAERFTFFAESYTEAVVVDRLPNNGMYEFPPGQNGMME